MRHDLQLEDEQGEACDDEHQSDRRDGELLRGKREEDQRDRSDEAGDPGSGVIEFGVEPREADQEQEVNDRRVGEEPRDPLFEFRGPRPDRLDDGCARQGERGDPTVEARHLATVQLPEEIIAVLGDEVDDTLLHGRGVGERRGRKDSLVARLDVSAPMLGDRTRKCGEVVGGLLEENVALRALPHSKNDGRGSGSRAGGHCRHVGGDQ